MRKAPSLPLLFGLAFVCCTVGYPLAVLFMQSLWPEALAGSAAGFLSAYAEIFRTPGLGTMLLNSVLWGVTVTIGSWLIGVPSGWLLARSDVPGKNWLRLTLLIPAMSPAYIAALAYIMIIQPGGFGDMAGGTPETIRRLFFSFWGVSVVMILSSYGSVALAVEAVLRSIPSRLEDTAAGLGADAWSRMRWITLPLLLPAVLNLGILVFLDTISNFGVPAVLGPRANLPLLPAEIYHQVTSWPVNLPLATALSVLLCIVAVVMLGLAKRVLARAPLGRSRVSQQRIIRLGGWQAAVLAWFGFWFTVAGVLPLAAVAAASMVKTWGGGTPEFTLAVYAAVFSPGSGALQALGTSALLGFATATICMFAGGVTAYAVARHPGKLAALTDAAGILPRTVPRIVIAVAFILAWNAPWILIEIYNTVWLLLIAYIALYQSDALRFGDAGMRQVGVNLEQAAATLGAGRLRTIFAIVLPLLRPSLFAAWITTFVVCMRDWVASIILLPPGTQTVGSFIFSQFDQGDLSAAMAMATCAVVVSTLVLVALQQKSKSCPA